MRQTILLLLPFFLFHKIDVKLKERRSYDVIASFTGDTNRINSDFEFERMALPFRYNRADMLSSLDSTLFRHGLIRPENGVSFYSPLTNDDIEFMRETCQSHPEKYEWSKRRLRKMGIRMSETTALPSTPDPTTLSLIKVSMSPILFSRNGRKALFYAEYFSESGGGEGSIWLFERKDSKWMPVISENIWVN